MNKTNLTTFTLFLLMVAQAVANGAVGNIQIVPENPTSCDIVVITLSGGWGNSCIPNASAISVEGNDIYFDVTWDYTPGFCYFVISSWELTRSVGPLAPGTYYIYARLFEYSQIPGEYELIAEFTVTAESCVPTVYYVDAANGNDLNDGLTSETAFATIQKAVDVAKSGDTIIVAPGVYIGNGNRDIDFYCKAITVRSADPTDPNIVASTIVDCNGAGYGFNFRSNEGPNSVLAGFTITNGHAGIHLSDYSCPTISHCIITNNCAGNFSVGIRCNNSSPTITNCTISENSAPYGRGIIAHRSNLLVANCLITGNVGADHGGGIYCRRGGSLTITGSTIRGNAATFRGGGIKVRSLDSVTITNCIISDNTANSYCGGGFFSYGSSIVIANCTFYNNSAPNGNALAFDSWYPPHPSNVQLKNCILWDGGNEIWNDDGSTIIVTYSDVQGTWPDLGNIDSDPCFVQPGYWADANDPNAVWVVGDYHLLLDSPCIDAGDNNSVPADIHDLDGDGNTAEPLPFDLDGNPRFVDRPDIEDTGNGTPPIVDMGAYEAMVSCFGVNHVKLGTKAGKKGNKVEVKGTFDPASPIDFAVDDVTYIIDDGLDYMLTFIIPAGSFEPEGKPDKQKFRFHSAKGSQPDIKARFDFLKCKFELKVKGVMDTSEITAETLAIVLQAGANIAQEIVELEVKGKKGEHLEYKRKPKFECCPEM